MFPLVFHEQHPGDAVAPHLQTYQILAATLLT